MVKYDSDASGDHEVYIMGPEHEWKMKTKKNCHGFAPVQKFWMAPNYSAKST